MDDRYHAPMESFFSRLKVELIYAEKFESFEDAKIYPFFILQALDLANHKISILIIFI